MPQSEAKFQINQFTGGLVTDGNPLEDQGPISTDEDNCELLFHGGRRRRRGLQFEQGHTFSLGQLSTSDIENSAFSSFTWSAVAGVPGLDFEVTQVGNLLEFYDKGQSSLSGGFKSFFVSLNNFRAPAASLAEVQTTLVSMASGKGALFVSGSAINPFFVEYNPTTDSITTTQIDIEIRDFDEQAPEVEAQDLVTALPTTGAHLYDLLNQGWYQRGPGLQVDGETNLGGNPVIVHYQADQGHFPRKNTPWHVGKYIVASDGGFQSQTFISPQQVRSAPSGTTLAPFGHYILNAFNKDRAQAVRDEFDLTINHFLANLNSLDVETESERPVSTAFFAGRAWYLLKNKLYFSQLLDADTLTKAGRCYQEGDPTSEGESDIVATDGGVISIPDMGRGTALAVLETTLVVFSDNGIWTVSGPEGTGFSAVDFSITSISNIKILNSQSIVRAEGLLFFWGDHGIYVIQPGEIRAILQVNDMTENRITEFYNNIPQSSKRTAKGVYEPDSKTIHWLYAGTAQSDLSKQRFQYDKFLNFSLKYSAFFPYSVNNTSTHRIIGASIAGGISTVFSSENVVDSSSVVITDSNIQNVTIISEQEENIATQLKVWTLSNGYRTYSAFENLCFRDFPAEDDGSGNDGFDYSSSITTFYHLADDYMSFMKAPYVYTYFRRTEEDLLTLGQQRVTLDQVGNSGFVFDPTFINYNQTTTPNNMPALPPNAAMLVAVDGTRIMPTAITNRANTEFYNIDTGAALPDLTRSNEDYNADAQAALIIPPGGFVSTNYFNHSVSYFVVPGTAYFVIILGSAAGVSSDKYFMYYRVNSATSMTLMGGYACRTDGLNVQGSPENGSEAFSGMGHIITDSPVDVSTLHPDAATNNSSYEYKHPLVVSYFAETRSTVLILPSINFVINNTPILESGSSPWLAKEISLANTGAFDGNTLAVTDNNLDTTFRGGSRGFFLPIKDNNSKFFSMFYTSDLEAHDAGTETITSTYLDAVSPTFMTGLISSARLNITPGAGNFGVSGTAGAVRTENTTFSDFGGTNSLFPFDDDKEEFDGTASTALDNYYCNPSAFPLNKDDPLGLWFLFWPRIYRASGDQDKMGIRVFVWDPQGNNGEGEARQIDFLKGQVWTNPTDLPATHVAIHASVYWNRTNNNVTVIANTEATGIKGLAVYDFGSYTPEIKTIDYESSCFLQTRWDWANNTASGKLGPSLQAYRDGRVQFVTDPDNPETTGLPLVVSRNKTRGRGRSLQLHFTSETEKDFELYGWAVWSAKNRRF
jgi:hypothetical protein